MEKVSSYMKAMELKGILHQEIACQEGVLENAGECYEGHNQDVAEAKTLLNAVDVFIASCEIDRKD